MNTIQEDTEEEDWSDSKKISSSKFSGLFDDKNKEKKVSIFGKGPKNSLGNNQPIKTHYNQSSIDNIDDLKDKMDSQYLKTEKVNKIQLAGKETEKKERQENMQMLVQYTKKKSALNNSPGQVEFKDQDSGTEIQSPTLTLKSALRKGHGSFSSSNREDSPSPNRFMRKSIEKEQNSLKNDSIDKEHNNSKSGRRVSFSIAAKALRNL
jgi:hypothetical protein